MADNIVLNTNSTTGATLAADEISSVHHQRVKVQYGTDGSATDVSDTNPLPVDDAGGSLTIDNAALAVTGGGVEASALRVTLASDSTGVVSVDDNGGALTVDGTVTANLSATDNAVLDAIDSNTDYGATTGGGTESGALRVTIANNSTGLLSVDDNGGSLTVDNGGTFATQIDGDALTALQLIDDPVFADDAAFTLASSKVSMAGAIRDDALSTLTAVEGDAVPLRVSSTGALHVTGGGGGTEYNEDDVAPNPIVGTATLMERDDALATLTPAEGDFAAFRCNARGALWVEHDTTTAIPVTDNGGSLTVDGAHIATEGAALGSGVLMHADDGTDRHNLQADASGNLKVIAQANSGVDIGDVDITSIVPGTGATNQGKAVDSAAGATDTGIAALVVRDDVLGTLTPADGDYTHIRVNSEGAAHIAGATSMFKSIDLDESEEEIKGSAGKVYWIHAMNQASAKRYLKLYNATAANVTVGTTTPDFTFPLATQGDTNGAGFTISFPGGQTFGTAITAAATTGVADNDSGAPNANDVVLNVGYT